MTVVRKKGEWKFGYRDTFSLDHTLAPIIKAGLEKFLEVLEKKETEGKAWGIPSDFCDYDENYNVTAYHTEKWFDALREMIWAFGSDKMYSMKGYDLGRGFWDEREDTPEEYKFHKQERERYKKDSEAYYERQQKGYELFAKHFNDLWW